MKNKFVYVWSVLLLIVVIGLGYWIFEYVKYSKLKTTPQRLFVKGIVAEANEDILEIEVTSEDGAIKQGTVIEVKIPVDDKKKGFEIGDKIKIYYFIPCNYEEGKVWEPHQIVK